MIKWEKNVNNWKYDLYSVYLNIRKIKTSINI